MVETLQHPWEIEQLLHLWDHLDAQNALEIGAWEGGTLRHWLTSGTCCTEVVVIDDAMRRSDEWQALADSACTTLDLIKGRSQDPAVIECARDHGPYDFVFIDADHTYDAGRQDWENYSPMVASGGLIALHDIRRYEHGDLDRLWDEIKPGRRTLEIHDRGREAWGGIGVVWM